MIQIVTVVNKRHVYDSNIKNNIYMSGYNLITFDNSKDNISISKRYNDFILNSLNKNSWIIFCHQDFAFMEDPGPIINNLNKNCIYGVIGIVLLKNWLIKIIKKILPIDNRLLYGQIIQGGEKKLFKHGKYLSKPKQVDTVDCCCIIVHGSLIKEHNLLFDEQLGFHLYSEDFSLSANLNHGVLTKAVQIKCKHLSKGDYNPAFENAKKYLRDKYPNLEFATTTFNFS